MSNKKSETVAEITKRIANMEAEAERAAAAGAAPAPAAMPTVVTASVLAERIAKMEAEAEAAALPPPEPHSSIRRNAWKEARNAMAATAAPTVKGGRYSKRFRKHRKSTRCSKKRRSTRRRQ